MSNDDFIADLSDPGDMDLTKLYNESFIVAVSTGDRDKCKLLSSTIHGPYDFYEMLEHVGSMYSIERCHAKVIILNKDRNSQIEFLDSKTTDYIEVHWKSILSNKIFDIVLGEPKIEASILIAEKGE